MRPTLWTSFTRPHAREELEIGDGHPVDKCA